MDERKRALKKASTIQVYVTQSQRERIEAAAFRREQRLSEFMREIALQVAAEDEKPRRGRPRGSA